MEGHRNAAQSRCRRDAQGKKEKKRAQYGIAEGMMCGKQKSCCDDDETESDADGKKKEARPRRDEGKYVVRDSEKKKKMKKPKRRKMKIEFSAVL